jgi:hypothetical protein
MKQQPSPNNSHKDTLVKNESQLNNPVFFKNNIDDLLKKQKPVNGITLTDEEQSIYNNLQKLYIDVSKPDEVLPVCIEIMQESETIVTGTYGSVSLIKGKTKSRKTFFHTLIMAAWLIAGELQNKIKITKPKNKTAVLHVDSEMGIYYVKPVHKRVLSLAGLNPNQPIPHFKTIEAVGLNFMERRKYLDVAIRTTENLGLVVIDGIRELMSDPNNVAETFEVIELLKSWANKYFIHIICVLHENPGMDAKARGHIGTEAEQKAETTYRIKKEGDISTVEAAFCRNKDFEIFGFCIDANTLPQIISVETSRTDKAPVLSPENTSPEILLEILTGAFDMEAKQRFRILRDNVKKQITNTGSKASDALAEKYIKYFLATGKIMTEGTPKTGSCFYYSTD